MPKKEITDAPTFAGVALDTLPAAVKGASASTIATGTAILAQLDAGLAAVEATVHADRKAAVTRAAQLKRSVSAVRDGVAVSHRVIAADGGFQVAILFRDPDTTDAPATEAAAE